MHIANEEEESGTDSSRVTLIDVAKLMDDRNKKVRLVRGTSFRDQPQKHAAYRRLHLVFCFCSE